MFRFLIAIFSVAALSACALRDRTSSADRVPISAELHIQAPEFDLSGHREINTVYSVRNVGKQPVRLDFSTGQHMEITVGSADKPRIFLWSEDRLFPSYPSVLVINPGERVVYEANVPTRDMVAGTLFTVEAFLVGHPETRAIGELRPR